jgi:flagellar basal-body rod modification protein FlgD
MDAIAPPGLSSTTSQSPAPSGTLGKHDFLRLLTAQLSHQDPLSPMQGTEFVAQLAQFSSLEQLWNLSDRVNALALAQTAAIGAQAVSFVGRTVTARGGSFRLDGAGGATLTMDLAQDASKVTITVVDSAGRTVATREIGALGKGRQTYAFDGRDRDGHLLPAGTYTFRVEAQDASGGRVEATALTRGTVDSVVYSGGAPTLKIGGVEVLLGDVMEVAS